MPAANLTELFDFEGQFEAAAQAILQSSGINAYISQQSEQMALLSTGVSFDLGPALNELTQLASPSNWQAGAPQPQEYFRYNGALEFEVAVPRDANEPVASPGVDTMFAQVRGRIRSAMMLCVAPFTDANLPYCRVSDIRPNGTSIGFNGARNVDFCTLRFALTFAIQPTAWPAWIES